MSIDFLIELLSSRHTSLRNARAAAVSLGDFATIVKIDTEIGEVEITLARLRMLLL
jgi:HAMP domain-containing protein